MTADATPQEEVNYTLDDLYTSTHSGKDMRQVIETANDDDTDYIDALDFFKSRESFSRLIERKVLEGKIEELKKIDVYDDLVETQEDIDNRLADLTAQLKQLEDTTTHYTNDLTPEQLDALLTKPIKKIGGVTFKLTNEDEGRE